jgi:predicted glutamine amidotransferase
MCRLLGIVNKAQIETEIFTNFKQQCKTGCVKSSSQPGHMDGWGMAYKSKGEMVIKKSGLDAASDPEFDNVAGHVITSELVIAHIRKATDPKTKGKAEFAHPFEKENWVLAHNGSVFWKDSVKKNYPGLIDTQILLEKLVENIKKEKFPFSGVEKTMVPILEHEKYTALNFLLTDGQNLIIYRSFDSGDPENESYYSLNWKKTDHKIIVASEPVDKTASGWKLLENNQLLAVDLDLNIKSKILKTIERIKVS